MSELALLGGTPVRTAPFRSLPCVDDAEINAVTAAMRDGLFSRFVGSNLPGTRELLTRSSAELAGDLGSFSFLGGPNVRRFEAEWAALHSVPFAIAVNSATSGLTAILMAMDIGPGAEVITTPLSFTATSASIVAAQATPVFVDIDEQTLNLDPDAVERCITPATRAIVAVHWCGNAGDFDRILEIGRRYGLPVIEDAAQAPGTRYQGRPLGSWGAAGVFSFSEPKNVMTGEGGMIITSDPRIAEKCRLIRNHGEVVPDMFDDDAYLRNVIGYNFRMVEVVAAMGWVQAGRLSELNRRRNRNYGCLRRQLDGFAYLNPQRVTHPETFAAYTAAFRWDDRASGVPRDAVAAALRSEGIPVATGVGRLMSDHPMFLRRIAYGLTGWPFTASADYNPARLAVAHRVHDQQYLGFFLLGWPNSEEDMGDIVRAFEKIASNLKELRDFSAGCPVALCASDRGRGR